ncbi:MAG: hypothetical protein KDH96_10465 [Candidatus Riesia sp.]|nr:hypothetical protein [Candidatus Riesia sp.]
MYDFINAHHDGFVETAMENNFEVGDAFRLESSLFEDFNSTVEIVAILIKKNSKVLFFKHMKGE